MKINAARRLKASQFVAARTTPWFLVESLKGQRPTLWCRKRESGLYDLFKPSPRGPYVTGLTDLWLTRNVRAIRKSDGSLTVADPREQRFIQQNLTKYLEIV